MLLASQTHLCQQGLWLLLEMLQDAQQVSAAETAGLRLMIQELQAKLGTGSAAVRRGRGAGGRARSKCGRGGSVGREVWEGEMRVASAGVY